MVKDITEKLIGVNTENRGIKGIGTHWIQKVITWRYLRQDWDIDSEQQEWLF